MKNERENIRVTVVKLELLSSSFKNLKDNMKKDMKIDVNFEMTGNNSVDFFIDFTFTDYGMEISGSYLLKMIIDNVEQDHFEDFLSREKKHLVYPVYGKISHLISFLSDQSRLIPLIVDPTDWLKDEN